MSRQGVLLVLLLVLPTLYQGASAASEASQDASKAGSIDLEDPANDVQASAAPLPAGGIPGAGPTGPHDVLRFRVGNEDQEAIEFEVQVADQNAPGAFTTISHLITFGLQGTDVRYSLEFVWFSPLAAPTMTGSGGVPTYFCYMPDGTTCHNQWVRGTGNWDTSTLFARVPKASFRGLAPVNAVPSEAPVPTSPPLPEGGAVLEDFVLLSRDVEAATTGEDLEAFFDRVPDASVAGPLQLRFPLAPAGIRVALDPPSNYGGRYQDGFGYYPVAPVPPNLISTARLRVANDAPQARLVNLSFMFPRDGPTDVWGISIVKTLTVPANGSRLVNVIFDPRSIPFDTRQLLVVAAHSVNEPEVTAGTAFEIVSSAPPPGPTRRELYFHARDTDDPAVDLVLTPLNHIPFLSASGWMNTERIQEGSHGDDGVTWGYNAAQFPNMESYATFVIDYATPRDLVLNLQSPAHLTLRVQSNAPITGTLDVNVLAASEATAQATKQISVTGTQDVLIELPLVRTNERIPAGSTIAVAMRFIHEGTTTASFATSPPLIIPGGSKLELPFIPDPSPQDELIPAGPAVVGISSPDKRDAFVNPGNETLFNATVVNEGILDDIVRLEAFPQDGNWTTRVVPATEFRLKPGASAVIGLYVKAPENATEGDRTTVELRVSSTADESARASLTFTTTATSGVEIADEAGAYQTDEDTERHRIAAKSTGTPGVPAIALLVSLAVLAVVHNRLQARKQE